MTMKIMFIFNPQKRKMIKKYCSLFKNLPILKFLNVKPWNIDGIHEIYKIHDFDDILEKYSKIKGEIN
jgi:hypothetical protein